MRCGWHQALRGLVHTTRFTRGFDYNLCGIVLADGSAEPGQSVSGLPVASSADDAAAYICREWVDEVFVYLPGTSAQPAEFMNRCAEMGVTVHTVLNIREVDRKKQFVETLGGNTVLTTAFNYISPYQAAFKRVPDIIGGLVGGHTTEQIALAHTYGSGDEDSCENTARAVSDLLCGLPIDGYIAFTMDAVPILNDLVGGVTVTLEDDIPELGEEYVRGAAITLRGRDALRFVRQRDIHIDDSNITRMKNQRLYLAGFTDAVRETAAKNPDLAVDAFKAVDKYICTNMTVNNISELVDKLVNYDVAPVVSPKGEVKLGTRFAEFYVDEADLQKCVIEAFCN